LQVESTPGEGSKFWFDVTLPLVEHQLQTKPNEFQMIVGLKNTPPKILIVDDEAGNRDILTRMLQSVGFQTEIAVNGEDALAKVNVFEPNLILMDVFMPVMDGLQATERLRETKVSLKLPIIATSAGAFAQQRENCLAAGCNGFVSKPIKLEVLLKEISTHLNLEWIYNQQSLPTPKDETSSDCLINLPTDQIDTLLSLARKGDIKRIRQKIDELETLNEDYKPFVIQMRQLTKKYQIKKIRDLMESYNHS
jgi:CheY-like chemotaxis protein